MVDQIGTDEEVIIEPDSPTYFIIDVPVVQRAWKVAEQVSVVLLNPQAEVHLVTRRKRMVYFHAPVPVVHRLLSPGHKIVGQPGTIWIWNERENPPGHGAEAVGWNNVSRERITHKATLPIWACSL